MDGKKILFGKKYHINYKVKALEEKVGKQYS